MLLSMFFLSFMIALSAVVYVRFLPHQDILGWWFVFGARFEGRWFYKPIWGCEYCISGQLSFWSYVITWVLSANLIEISFLRHFLYSLVSLPALEHYSALMCVIFVSMAISFSKVLSLLYTKYLD